MPGLETKDNKNCAKYQHTRQRTPIYCVQFPRVQYQDLDTPTTTTQGCIWPFPIRDTARGLNTHLEVLWDRLHASDAQNCVESPEGTDPTRVESVDWKVYLQDANIAQITHWDVNYKTQVPKDYISFPILPRMTTPMHRPWQALHLRSHLLPLLTYFKNEEVLRSTKRSSTSTFSFRDPFVIQKRSTICFPEYCVNSAQIALFLHTRK